MIDLIVVFLSVFLVVFPSSWKTGESNRNTFLLASWFLPYWDCHSQSVLRSGWNLKIFLNRPQRILLFFPSFIIIIVIIIIIIIEIFFYYGFWNDSLKWWNSPRGCCTFSDEWRRPSIGSARVRWHLIVHPRPSSLPLFFSSSLSSSSSSSSPSSSSLSPNSKLFIYIYICVCVCMCVYSIYMCISFFVSRKDK